MSAAEQHAFILGLMYGVPLGALVWGAVTFAVRRNFRHRAR